MLCSMHIVRVEVRETGKGPAQLVILARAWVVAVAVMFSFVIEIGLCLAAVAARLFWVTQVTKVVRLRTTAGLAAELLRVSQLAIWSLCGCLASCSPIAFFQFFPELVAFHVLFGSSERHTDVRLDSCRE